MDNTRLKASVVIEEFQDEISEICSQCGVAHVVAYWDEELECYIYLSASESNVCSTCQSDCEVLLCK
jgi:hypothetical protein